MPQLNVGDVLRLAERDYRYGTGPLLLRITAIGVTRQESNGLWLEVRGHEVRWNGEADPRERHALVRLEAARIVSSREEP
jgi:hypothetical protein